MSSQLSHTLSKIVIGGFALYFLYLFVQVLDVVDRRHIGTSEGTYVNSTSSNSELRELALTLTQGCDSDTCRVQRLLDYVTQIPYVVNHFTAHSPQETIKQNFGDCDDKSNLLISLLHSLHIESYFVLVPEHIFVIVALEKLAHQKALYLDNKPFYILESTAMNSHIGFPLKYTLDEISAIVDPFLNEKLNLQTIEYK